MHAFTLNLITETRITSEPIQHVSTVRPVYPTLIITILLVSPMPTDLIYCSFTPEKVLTSLQNASSPFGFKNHQFSVSKTKVSSRQKKLQFSGTCENKSHQMLHPKDRLIGTGWKKMREKQGLHRFIVKGSSQKSLHFMKSPSQKKKRTS